MRGVQAGTSRLSGVAAFIETHPRLVTPLALIPFLALAWREWPFQPDLVTSDYSQYLAHAAALLDGRPYTDTGYLYNPAAWGLGPVAYPPGWPLVLAAAGLVFGLHLGVAKAVTVLIACALLLAVGAYFRREYGPVLALAVVLVLGLSPEFVIDAVAPISDVPFAALVWATILVADSSGTWSWKRVALVTALAGFAVLVRPHGVVLMGALAVWALLSRRRLGNRALIPAATLVVASVVGRLVIPSGRFRVIPSFDTLWGNLVDTSRRDLLPVLESHLYPFPLDGANDAYHIASLGLMLLGLLAFAREKPFHLAIWFALAYGLAIAILTARISARFALPMFPLFVFGLLNGIRVLVERVRRERGALGALAFAAVLTIGVVVPRLAGDHPPRTLDAPQFRSLIAHVEARVAAGEEVRLASMWPRLLAWESGAPGTRFTRATESVAHLATWCRYGITHVVIASRAQADGPFARAGQAVRAVPDAFTLEFSNDRYEVHRFDRGTCVAP